MAYTGNVFTQPTATTFTNLNTSAVSGTAVTNIGDAITLYVPGHSGNNLVGQYVAAPSTPYCCIANLTNNQGDIVSSSYTQEPITFGIGFYDGTKLVWIRALYSSSYSTALYVTESATVSAITSNVAGNEVAGGIPSAMINWFQIKDDGTNITFLMAMNESQLKQPYQWVQIYSQARTSYLANVNNICWLVDSNGSSSAPNSYVTLNSWQTVNL